LGLHVVPELCEELLSVKSSLLPTDRIHRTHVKLIKLNPAEYTSALNET